MAEQGVREHHVVEARHVDRHEPAGAARQPMQRAGHELLARAGLAGDHTG